MAPIDATSLDFPHPVLTKIGDLNTEPTFTSILVAHVELNANTASIYSARGDGLQGHLALTIDANDYVKRSLGNKSFEPPTAPSSFPSHSESTSDAQIAETNGQHKAKKEEFILFHNAYTALRNLLIAAVPSIFLADQRDPMTGFGNKTVLQLLTYLHTTFGSISEKELELNTARMQLQWNPPTAIEALFLQLENGVSFATTGQDAPTKPTILRWAYNNIKQTGRFDIACHEWRQMESSAKTGRFSSGISRRRTRISGAWTPPEPQASTDQHTRYSTQPAPRDSTAQHTQHTPQAPCSLPLNPPLPSANWP
jgi:hypothetical protein